MPKQTVKVPDIGTDQAAEVSEVLVREGDIIEVEQSIIVLETDKASVEVPSSHAGKVTSVLVKEGDELNTGAVILELETDISAGQQTASSGEEAIKPAGREQPVVSDEVPAGTEEKQAPREEVMREAEVTIPDVGEGEVTVIEVSVAVGDEVNEGDSLIVLESDKASMELPATASGKVAQLLVKEGDTVREGQQVAIIQAIGGAEAPAAPLASAPAATKPAAQEAQPRQEEKQTPQEIQVTIPDVGEGDVEVIEVSVAVGDEVGEGDSLIVLESEKASMELPSPAAGKVTELLVKEGDKVRQGQQVAVVQALGSGEAPAATQSPQPQTERPAAPAPSAPAAAPAQQTTLPEQVRGTGTRAYVGPSVRKLARELGVDLDKVKPSGPRNRLLKEDLRSYVRELISRGGGGSAIPEVPKVDFSRFGEIKRVKMSKIKRATAANMQRSWLNVPHVTQFDDADITALEDYRKKQKAEAEKRGVKLTPLPFILKACALTLKEEPSFNVSLDPDGQHIIEKQYVHIGMAVDTPQGLMVPVIRDVDQKSIWELAEETVTLAGKARDGKLTPREMQGGCFTVSSLGAIGGQGFTPIVNTPEVGILGVSKASIKPFWDGKQFVPHNFLPLSLSYDHRAVNGADAGRFLTHLVSLLSNHKDWVD